jgi:AbrB family looped-hinge helix DNA binding protein
MPLTTLTSKGQVTIPKEIRDAFGLQSGDKVEFLLAGEEEAIFRPVTKKVDEVFGRLRKPGRKPVSVKEMDRATKRMMKERFR